ncbi:MAG TPA: HD domain-containing protein [Caulobacteraceae bacterium]|nr:HD domain-containing protein [Caulobacteraceae bacterium]
MDIPTPAPPMTPSERADALEEQMLRELNEKMPARSVLYGMWEGEVKNLNVFEVIKNNPGQHFLMTEDKRLPRLPDAPTLVDFMKLRMASTAHVLQSADHALKAGLPEKTVLACLLHDIAVGGFIRCDHGYWGAQMLEPYVDEEISWAIRAHQALRFFPDESVGYEYPELYRRLFGPDYRPEPYIVREYEEARRHKWYMTARMITLYDIYSFDPNAVVEIEAFEDIIGRHFRQPKEGLGWDNTPASHMWRTMNWPTRLL